jgi:hypothetical protein
MDRTGHTRSAHSRMEALLAIQLLARDHAPTDAPLAIDTSPFLAFRGALKRDWDATDVSVLVNAVWFLTMHFILAETRDYGLGCTTSRGVAVLWPRHRHH